MNAHPLPYEGPEVADPERAVIIADRIVRLLRVADGPERSPNVKARGHAQALADRLAPRLSQLIGPGVALLVRRWILTPTHFPRGQVIYRLSPGVDLSAAILDRFEEQAVVFCRRLIQNLSLSPDERWQLVEALSFALGVPPEVGEPVVDHLRGAVAFLPENLVELYALARHVAHALGIEVEPSPYYPIRTLAVESSGSGL